MKKILILFPILLIGLRAMAQESDYETQLAMYMSEFKNDIYSEEARSELLDKVYSLKDQIEIHINLHDTDNPEYRTLLRTGKKINAFYNYLRVFSDYKENMLYDDFMIISDILGITPFEKPGLTCNHLKVYEIKVGSFRALLFRNLLIPTDIEYKNMKVDYDYDYNGRIISGSSMNVGGAKVRCAMYLSDSKTNYYKIVTIRCSELKSSFTN